MPLRGAPSPRYKMKSLSKQLRTLTFPTSPISVDLAQFAADAFDSYLSGRSRTLDAAFGLKKKRGAPGWPKARRRMAAIVYELKKAKKSKSQIQAELQRRGFRDTDWSTIKRTYQEWRLRLLRVGVGKLLSQPDPPDTKTPSTGRGR